MQLDNSIPKYEVTYRTILDRLKSGRYPVGSRIPTEGELARHFDVSRVTIRRALDMLVQDGYVESRQGSGYTVLTLSPVSDTCLTSFTDAMLRAGREPTSKLLSIATLAPDAPELQHLPDDMGAGTVTIVDRLRLVDGKPRMFVRTYAPAHLLDDAAPEDFPEAGPDQSILRILSARFNVQWSAACEDISPVLADGEMADLLHTDTGAPLLKQACTAFDENGAAVFFEEVYRNGPVSFNLSQQTRLPRHNN